MRAARFKRQSKRGLGVGQGGGNQNDSRRAVRGPLKQFWLVRDRARTIPA